MVTDDDLLAMARTELAESVEVKQRYLNGDLTPLIAAAKLIARAFESGGKLLLCGNGGSAADCQHLAAEFVCRLSAMRERPALPAIALTTDCSTLTAYANDFGFEGVFMRQVEALGQTGDVLLGISTSGNSKNVLLAIESARRKGLMTIGLMGRAGEMGQAVDVAITVPSDNTNRIQETHLALEHLLCGLVEAELYGLLEQDAG
jgi:D-sedoheptulose 7-phosphate isomerase